MIIRPSDWCVLFRLIEWKETILQIHSGTLVGIESSSIRASLIPSKFTTLNFQSSIRVQVYCPTNAACFVEKEGRIVNN